MPNQCACEAVNHLVYNLNLSMLDSHLTCRLRAYITNLNVNHVASD